jgi:hypothetical protein
MKRIRSKPGLEQGEVVGATAAPADANKKRTYYKAKREGTQAHTLPAGISTEQVEGENLEIKLVETSKDKIAQPRLAKDPRKLIPQLGASVVINGKSGSGKSTLLTNYLTGSQFYGKCGEKPNGWFDEIFWFSPTAGEDDVQQAVGVKKNHIYTDLDEAPELLRVILDSQKGKLKGGGKAHKVPQYAVVFDDVIGETKFMGTKEFLQTFYMVRHRNCTTFICSQHYKRVPKVCRLQASFVHFFAGSQAEVEQVVEDFAPPLYTKNEFRDMVNLATRGNHAFLTICMKVGWEYRFRHNLGKFFKLDRLADVDNEDKDKTQGDKDKTVQATEASGDANKRAKTENPSQQICEDQGNAFHANLSTIIAYLKRKHEQNEQKGKVLRQC